VVEVAGGIQLGFDLENSWSMGRENIK
jgi:hypothetical protein